MEVKSAGLPASEKSMNVEPSGGGGASLGRNRAAPVPVPRTIAVTILPTWTQAELCARRSVVFRLCLAPVDKDPNFADWVFEFNLWTSGDERARPAVRYHADKTEECIRPGSRALIYFGGKFSDKYRWAVNEQKSKFPDVNLISISGICIHTHSLLASTSTQRRVSGGRQGPGNKRTDMDEEEDGAGEETQPFPSTPEALLPSQLYVS